MYRYIRSFLFLLNPELAHHISMKGLKLACFFGLIRGKNISSKPIMIMGLKFPNRIALGLDAKDGYLSISGWKENSNQLTLDYLNEVNDFGASRLIYTDINRDGMKQSPNFEETAKVADTSNCPVIISGGVSSIEDIKKAKELNNKNIEGIIVGKAIYDGDIKLEELVKELDA